MPQTTLPDLQALTAALAAVGALSVEQATLAALSDDRLLDWQAGYAELTRSVQVRSAAVVGEIARRSAPELGHDGLAQRTGHRTPEKFVAATTGVTEAEARTLVSVGAIMVNAAETDAGDPTTERSFKQSRPWLDEVGRAVARDELSVAKAEAIRNGLGDLPAEQRGADSHTAAAGTDHDTAAGAAGAGAGAAAGGGGVTVADLAGAVLRLLAEAPELSADRLYRRARELRDELDAAGILDRERALHQARSIRRYRQPDGMTRYVITADPENAELIDETIDALTSPKRGGPRFVTPAELARAEAIESDPRSPEQLAFDGFLALLQLGIDADPGQICGSRKPAVRLLVAETELHKPDGRGWIEGQKVPVSMQTITRAMCEAGVVPISFGDDGQSLRLGREQRLFNPKQRLVLAARDGGCMWPDCDRPASWCEAHHIDEWDRDHGLTDIDNGILLCRHHHLLLHDHGWSITRAHGQYWLIPPAAVDPQQKPRPMPSRSQALADLQQRPA
ncbi:HNH endonuclease signature motif containing protein [Salinibacterium sp. ZJ450]|uniref:HNH endonuclease signature motif containing protein n=1 Tax=Salinibacterium sp. ZJ450 TaxID=2708338 RepID=UPI0014227202|nr:HNH endonuclease signature motif containing protein [Salinibacterium sp. ZJ450]